MFHTEFIINLLYVDVCFWFSGLIVWCTLWGGACRKFPPVSLACKSLNPEWQRWREVSRSRLSVQQLAAERRVGTEGDSGIRPSTSCRNKNLLLICTQYGTRCKSLETSWAAFVSLQSSTCCSFCRQLTCNFLSPCRHPGSTDGTVIGAQGAGTQRLRLHHNVSLTDTTLCVCVRTWCSCFFSVMYSVPSHLQKFCVGSARTMRAVVWFELFSGQHDGNSSWLWMKIQKFESTQEKKKLYALMFVPSESEPVQMNQSDLTISSGSFNDTVMSH